MIYRLNKDGICVSEFRLNNIYESAFSGTLLNVESWNLDGTIAEYSFVANMSIKWDGCSHIHFYGEDTDINGPENDNCDAYYYLCGAKSYISFIRAIAFAYTLAGRIIDGFDMSVFNEMLELNLLNKCDIMEVPECAKVEDSVPF